jgi:hypothetical protein
MEDKTKKVKSVVVKSENQSVDGFISQAIAQSLPVETMEKLFSLREKVKAEAAKEAFVSAMAKFQAECPVISKDKKVNDRTGKLRYKYAPLDQIVSQVKKPLGNNDLFYSFKEEKDKDFATAICTITHKLGHSESSSFQVPIGNEDYMTDAQKYGARMTFAKRYAFCNALGILTGDEDTDDNLPKDKEPKSVKSQIMMALRDLGEKEVSPAGVKAAIVKLTQLEPSDETFDEILGRLQVLISEKNNDNPKV